MAVDLTFKNDNAFLNVRTRKEVFQKSEGAKIIRHALVEVLKDAIRDIESYGTRTVDVTYRGAVDTTNNH